MKKKTSGRASGRGRAVSEMREEYDFSHGERGKHAGRASTGVVMVELDPDVADAFPTAADVNNALRAVIASRR